MSFPVWDDQCEGCGHKQEKGDDEPFYKLECSACGSPGCHECMPLGRGSRCQDCVDPETGE